jgi:hypothetical protein
MTVEQLESFLSFRGTLLAGPFCCAMYKLSLLAKCLETFKVDLSKIIKWIVDCGCVGVVGCCGLRFVARFLAMTIFSFALLLF